MRYVPRPSRAGGVLTLLVTLLLALTTVGAPAALGTTGDVGYQDQAYNGAGGAPTADKPQSKLWYNDGLWWADMFDTVSKTWHIFRLDRPTETWVDTGTQIDNRANTHADMLWSGGKLYAASMVKAADSSSNVTGQPARLYRYSYSSATKTYTLDSGFPVNINNVSSESITLDRDSRGVLWATWTQGQSVYVNSTNGNDATWGTPFVVPVTGATGMTPDDISAIAAYGTNKIGLMWSNQNTGAFYFAIHKDNDPAQTWTGQVAMQSPSAADDHINLKQLEGDSMGHLYAAVKTSFDETGVLTAPQVELLALNVNSGNWDSYPFGTVSDCHTRPMIVIDSTNKVLHFFATAPSSGGCPYAGYPGTIYEKTTPLNNISFGPGRGTPVIRDAASANMNNVTGTKQNVNAASGIVILASNDATSRYWHNDLPISGSSPTASFTESPSSGTAPLSVTFTDTSTGNPTGWSWTFGDGGTSTAQSPSHTYTTAGTYTVALTVTSSNGATNTTNGTVTVSSAPTTPTGSFTATPTSGNAPLAVSFTDTSTGSPTSWSWDFGDTGTSTAQNPTHTYAAAGTYTVTLTATNAAGSNKATGTVTVTTAPAGTGIAFGGVTSIAQPTATTALVLTKPSQATAGDVLVASFSAANTPAVTAPTGWTPILSSCLKPGTGATVCAYTHVVTSADDTVNSWTWTLSTAQKYGGGIARFTGVDTTHPIDTTVSTAVDNTYTDTALTVPGITTQTNGAMLIGGLGADGSTATTNPPTGWTEAFDSTGGKMAEQAYTPQPTAGPTGSQTWTLSSARAMGVWLTALRPAP